jgi:hypothetical protein
MPTVLIVNGYRFFFFSLDRNEPIHIHVEKGEGYAKYWLKPIQLASSRGFRQHELSTIRLLIEENTKVFIKAWKQHFGN